MDSSRKETLTRCTTSYKAWHTPCNGMSRRPPHPGHSSLPAHRREVAATLGPSARELGIRMDRRRAAVPPFACLGGELGWCPASASHPRSSLPPEHKNARAAPGHAGVRALMRMEAAPGFEPGNKGFAVPRLTTWPCRHPKGVRARARPKGDESTTHGHAPPNLDSRTAFERLPAMRRAPGTGFERTLARGPSETSEGAVRDRTALSPMSRSGRSVRGAGEPQHAGAVADLVADQDSPRATKMELVRAGQTLEVARLPTRDRLVARLARRGGAPHAERGELVASSQVSL